MTPNRLWPEQLASLKFPKLTSDKETETVIVGGGITGLLTAYLLASAGKKPILLEKNSIGSGDSGSTTAIMMIPDVIIPTLRKSDGNERIAEAWKAAVWSIDFLESMLKKEGIDCEFRRCAAHVYAVSEEDAAVLKRVAAFGKKHGFKAEFRSKGLAFEKFGYLELANHATFDPAKLLRGLAMKIIELGGEIFTDSAVTEFTGKNGAIAITAHGKIKAENVVIATHSPIDNRFEGPMRMTAYQSYVIAANIPKGTIPVGAYWDSTKLYRYIRVDPNGEHDRILLGGEDHKTGEVAEGDPFAALIAHLDTLVGGKHYEVTHRWSGEVFETSDDLPFIGPSIFNAKHRIATGYDGTGTTFGIVAAAIISDDILGKKNTWAELFSPGRIRGLTKVMMLGARVIQAYFGDYLKLLRPTKKDLKPGEGKIMVIKGKRAAVSCGTDGKCVAVSAVCTHLGCLVRWNGVEKTWDCPCHGSRFGSKGEVITGPATKPLERL